MKTLTVPSPAKLNLMLHITGVREDGYHLLQTVFQLLDYGDTLRFSPRGDNLITLSPAIAGVAYDDNLIVKAAHLLQRQAPQPCGVDIKLTKVLPMGGGIGGGSSNAATTLLALSQLWELHLTIDHLAGIGLQLGADVPVFVRGHSAWAEGIGEQLQALSIAETWYLVIKPDCEVSTAEIFSHKQLTRNTSPITMAAFFEQATFNNCENVVRRLYPQVDAALKWLTDCSVNNRSARLTGTGACVYTDFPDKQSAQQAFNKLPEGLQGFIAKGVDVSPSHLALNL